jgi:hypothetical protein
MRAHRPTARARRLAAALLGVTILAALLLPAVPASAWEYVVGPPRQSVVSWGFPPGAQDGSERTVTIGISTGTCAGEKPPELRPVRVVELPISAAHPRPTAIITAHLTVPAPVEVSGEVKPGDPGPACADLGLAIDKRIKMKRPVKGMVFLDGSYNPPRPVKLPAAR